ncbi:TMEM175 family protein [Algoriphagus persicinus]|uniref:TMEM175 family protein n=1 Tax=Algoriphagus persicinus TaxID=3108754 RepID=UPI002B392966|nr:TMEM175 family protein [Algoriphagus sp. E1-3-M2]MEB2784334.1 TMEM175 family protein [Algoriphagus sp. E1-3-M2]
MGLEFKVSNGGQLKDLHKLVPVFLSYFSSFICIGIYWNNHHYMLHPVNKVNGALLWVNLHFLDFRYAL